MIRLVLTMWSTHHLLHILNYERLCFINLISVIKRVFGLNKLVKHLYMIKCCLLVYVLNVHVFDFAEIKINFK